jgi:hypothetical protein
MPVHIYGPAQFWPHKSAGDTPMCEGFRKAAECLVSWCNSHSKSHPPTIIHVTGGPSNRACFAIALEDVEDYKAFEAAITADYDAQSAVERELVLRLGSILWRLRRATTMETGLFEIQAQHCMTIGKAASRSQILVR